MKAPDSNNSIKVLGYKYLKIQLKLDKITKLFGEKWLNETFPLENVCVAVRFVPRSIILILDKKFWKKDINIR